MRALPGVGPRAEERLAAAGVTTIGALAGLSDPDLRALLPGQVGQTLRDRAQGIDPRRLETTSERISISVEETFERDLLDRGLLHAELRRMANDLGEQLQRNGQSARTVTAKLRYTDFSIRAARRASTSGSTIPIGSESSRAPCSTAGCATGPARCDSWGSGSRASRIFGSCAWTSTRFFAALTLKTGSICR